MARTSEEKTVDRLLTLYLINECYKTHNLRALSETKMQKLVFLSERSLIDRRIKAFNYSFVKLLHPTFSSELRGDLMNFVKFGYVSEPWFGQTKKMKMILEDFGEVLRRNRPLLAVIDGILSTYSHVRTNHLVNMVYRMVWSRGKTIKMLKLGTPLLYPLTYENAREVFRITPDELEDLKFCLNPKISKELDRAFDEMKRGELLSHEEVFG